MGNSELKEYVVTLYKHEDLDSFYEDMETPGGNLYIPDRAVEVANRRPISRNTHYWLTAEEAIQLKNDPRVWDVSLTPEELGLIPRPQWSRTANFTKTSTASTNDKNWGPYRIRLGSKIAGWGSDSTPTQSATINYALSGKNVDVVIVDGHIKANHAEFKTNVDGTGISRVNQFNWFSLNPTVLGTSADTYNYTDDTSNTDHGTHVAGIAAGNTQGLAIDANIYNISPYGDEPVYGMQFDYIRAWHNAKPVNPATGVKNPTVVNNSYGGFLRIRVSDLNLYNATITHRGTVYSGPWNSTGNGTKLYTELGFNNGALPLIAPYNSPADDAIEVHVVNASFLADISDAIADGIHIVWAAGNDGRRLDIVGGLDIDNKVSYNGDDFYINRSPYLGNLSGNLGYILNVGNIEKFINEPIASGSNKGPGVNIWAPGSGIVSSIGRLTPFGHDNDPRGLNGDRIISYDGTSMAAPQVTGFIATLLELKPTMSPADMFNYVRTVAKTGLIDTSLATNNSYSDLFSLQGSTNLSLFAPQPTFAINASTNNLIAGQSFTYTITTTNVPVGSKLYLVESGTSIAGDFVDGLTQIAVTTTGDSTTLSRTVSGTFTGSKTSILQVKTGGYNGTVQATASSVSLITTTTTTTTTTAAPGSTSSTTTTTAATFIPSGFDQSTVVRYANRYTLQIRDGVIDSSAGQIWQLVRGSLPPNSTLFSTGLITVNVSNILPFSREQFIQAGAPDLPSLGQAAWEQWLAQYVKLRQTFDYEFQVEISDGTGPAQIGHTVRIIHLKPPINVNFDMANFDRDAFDQTAGATSWFTINQAYLSVDPAQDYYLVMTTSPNSFSWATDSNLGEVINGSVSRIGFESIAADAARTYFQVKQFTASRLPQGVELLPDGYLSGRFSFRCHQDDSSNLPANDIYTFTVRTGTKNFYAYADRVFTLRVRRLNLQPYDSIWLNAFPPAEQRVTLYNLLTDPNTIPDDFIFRPSDPWWGRSTFFRILMLPSVNLRTQNQYEAAMQTNHYQKTLLFDQLRMSVMLDANLNSIYEVIYLTVRDDQLGRDYASGNYQRQPNQIDLRAYIKNYHIDGGQTFYTFYPNALENMRNILSTYIGMYNPGVAPEWMLSFQPVEDQPGVFTAPVGFMPVIVLAYCRPGRGRYVYHRLSTVNFNQFEFESDRFNQEARLSMNYNTVTNQFTPGEPVSFDNNSTEFDYNTTRVVDRMEYSAVPTDLDKYLIFPRFGVFR